MEFVGDEFRGDRGPCEELGLLVSLMIDNRIDEEGTKRLKQLLAEESDLLEEYAELNSVHLMLCRLFDEG